MHINNCNPLNQLSFIDSHRLLLIVGLCLILQNTCIADNVYSIENPGADLANFPNSAFTLPAGKAYIEMTPVNFSSRAAKGESAQYAFSTLLRYGLFDDLELRFFADGFIHKFDSSNTDGFSSQTFNLKWHIKDRENDSILPAIALESALTTDFLRSEGHNTLLPSLSINFDQVVFFGVAFEYNMGFITQADAFNQLQAQLALSWAFQREIINNTSVFIHGYTNTAAGATTSALGGGIQWTPGDKFTLFANVNAGLTRITPEVSMISGFALAF